MFTIYTGDELYILAVDPVLQKRKFEIPPGGLVNVTVAFRDLEFTSARGKNLDPKSVAATLRDARWRARVTMVDLSTPKPSLESNLTAWSNDVSFNEEPKPRHSE